ncbi:MAG TPA: MFS transporter [Mycobacteriales bacterium]|nr:MFS transporter [Mycobacteriales bacterium]
MPVATEVVPAPRSVQLPRPATLTAVQPASAPALSAAALVTVLVGVLLPMIDFFIVNVALPTMARDLHASNELLELVVAGYATAYAVLLVVGGRLGDAFGRRRLFLIGMTAFTATSLLCGLAPSAGLLVVARVLQGAAAAMMVPQTLSTIQATGDAVSRARALGWFGAAGGIAAVTGQVLGGVLVSANLAGSGWRPIFLVNVPIGLVGLWCAGRLLPETRSERADRPDLPGAALLGATVVAVLVPLTEGRALGWPVWSWLLLAAAPGFATAFAVVERRIERRGHTPLVPRLVLQHRSMRRGLSLSGPFFAGFGAFMFVYALVAQDALGFSPLRAGLALSPLAATFLVASLQMPRLVARHGRRVITAGATVQLVGLLALGLTLAAGWPTVTAWDLAPALAVMGYGQGLVMPPLIRVVLSEVPIESAGAGSGVLTTTQQVSLAVGVATFGSLFLTLAPAARFGTLHAALLVLAIQAVLAAGIAVASRGLPRGT